MKYLCVPVRIIVNVLPTRYYSTKPLWNVLFFGTDQFSLYTLKLLNSYYSKSEILNKLDVVTSVKKNANVVHKYAEINKLPVFTWPDIPSYTNYDLGLVVSFGYLIPERVIAKFSYGILNVHASILPRWRGAAPIIHAIAHGDKETGVTVMQIKPHYFDIGEILLQEKVPIRDDMEMPELHQHLGELGAECLIKTLENLPDYIRNSKPQDADNVTYAPKIKPEFATIKWNTMSSDQVYNLYRALKGYLSPVTTWQSIPTKLIEIKVCNDDRICDSKDTNFGFVTYDKRTKSLKVMCVDKKFVIVEVVGVYGKKIMNATDFNNGFLKKTSVDMRYFK